MSHKWPDVFAANFGRALSPREVSAWESELAEQHFRGRKPPFPGEIEAAIRALAAVWKDNYPPALPDVAGEMKARRRDHVRQQSGDGCAMCIDGWVQFVARPDADGPFQFSGGGYRFAIDRPAPGSPSRTVIPCACSAGKAYEQEHAKRWRGNVSWFDFRNAVMQALREGVE